jgi:hypothetical protein
MENYKENLYKKNETRRVVEPNVKSEKAEKPKRGKAASAPAQEKPTKDKSGLSSATFSVGEFFRVDGLFAADVFHSKMLSVLQQDQLKMN